MADISDSNSAVINFIDGSDSDEYVTIMSIDIGSKNLALYKERVNLSEIKKIKNIPEKSRYNNNKECNPSFKILLRNVAKHCKKTFLDKVDLTRKDDKRFKNRIVITNKILLRLTDYIYSLYLNNEFEDIDYFIIEKQLKTNPNAQEISYHIRSHLLDLFGTKKHVIMFPSKHKTQINGAPKKLLNSKNVLVKMTKTQRKNWAKDECFDILTDRNDMEGLYYIFTLNKSKADDLSDCIVMSRAFIYMLFIDNKSYLLE